MQPYQQLVCQKLHKKITHMTLMLATDVVSFQLLKTNFVHYDVYLIALTCNSMFYKYIAISNIFLLFGIFCFEMVWECILFCAFYFEIRQCNSYMKIEKIGQILFQKIRLRQTFVLKIFKYPIDDKLSHMSIIILLPITK